MEESESIPRDRNSAGIYVELEWRTSSNNRLMFLIL